MFKETRTIHAHTHKHRQTVPPMVHYGTCSLRGTTLQEFQAILLQGKVWHMQELHRYRRLSLFLGPKVVELAEEHCRADQEWVECRWRQKYQQSLPTMCIIVRKSIYHYRYQTIYTVTCIVHAYLLEEVLYFSHDISMQWMHEIHKVFHKHSVTIRECSCVWLKTRVFQPPSCMVHLPVSDKIFTALESVITII